MRCPMCGNSFDQPLAACPQCGEALQRPAEIEPFSIEFALVFALSHVAFVAVAAYLLLMVLTMAYFDDGPPFPFVILQALMLAVFATPLAALAGSVWLVWDVWKHSTQAAARRRQIQLMTAQSGIALAQLSFGLGCNPIAVREIVPGTDPVMLGLVTLALGSAGFVPALVWLARRISSARTAA